MLACCGFKNSYKFQVLTLLLVVALVTMVICLHSSSSSPTAQGEDGGENATIKEESAEEATTLEESDHTVTETSGTYSTAWATRATASLGEEASSAAAPSPRGTWTTWGRWSPCSGGCDGVGGVDAVGQSFRVRRCRGAVGAVCPGGGGGGWAIRQCRSSCGEKNQTPTINLKLHLKQPAVGHSFYVRSLAVLRPLDELERVDSLRRVRSDGDRRRPLLFRERHQTAVQDVPRTGRLRWRGALSGGGVLFRRGRELCADVRGRRRASYLTSSPNREKNRKSSSMQITRRKTKTKKR